MSADSAIPKDSSLVTFTILVDGQVIPGEYAVSNIEVQKDVNRTGYAKLKIFDGGFTGLKEDFPAANSGTFDPGKKIVIKVGYSSKETQVFEGVIVKQGLKLSSDKSFLTVECKEEAFKMTLAKANTVFEDKTDSDIISSLISKSGLTGTVESTSIKFGELVQYHCSDWDFMLMRADLNGMIVLVDGGKVKVAKPDMSGNAIAVVENGTNMFAIDLEVDARFQFQKVNSVGWDMVNQQIVKASSKTVKDVEMGLESSKLNKAHGVSEYLLQSPSNLSPSILESWATGKLTRSRLSKVIGTVKFLGNEKLIPGCIVELKGFSNQFNGNAFVSGVQHIIEEGDWVTQIKVGLPFQSYSEERTDINALSTSGMLAGIRGLQTAIVKKIDSDKDGQHRIQITYPTLQQDNMGVWARLATFYASNNCGAFFIPEVSDEVVVGFINEDPHQPIIIGSVYSSKNVPPLTSESKNQFKSLVTRSQMKLTFDEEKKIITIETPAKNSIVLDDDQGAITLTDKNNNKVELTKDGMTFTCVKDFTVKAQGKIILEAQADIQSKATGAYKVEGMSVEMKGSTKFAAEAAQVEVKGSAQTVVKGAMVMIN